MALIITGSGSDTINGTTNTDLIYSGSGNDVVNAGDGSDIVYLGNGNDTLLHNVTQNLNDYDLYIGGAGVDTLRLFVTTAQKAAIDATNMVSAFNASASTWLQIFNFGAYNSLLGFNLNILVQGFEKIEFVITDPVVNQAPTALDSVFSTNEDAGIVSVDLKTAMSVSDDAGVANVHVQSVAFASGEALSYSVVGDSLQFDANQYNSLLATNSVNPVLNVTFVDAGGLTVTKALTVHVQGVNDGPLAVEDVFAVDDTINASVMNLGNLLTNDTDPDSGDTKSVVSVDASISSYGLLIPNLGPQLSMASVTPDNASIVAQYTINALGVFNNDGSSDTGSLKIYADGHIELVKGSAFDFLADGQPASISGVYTMQDSAGVQSIASFAINVTGVDNNDVLIGTNLVTFPDTLNGGAGNDLIIGGLGADIIDGGAGVDTLSYFNSASGVSVNLATGVNTDNYVISNVENVIGTSFSDIIIGDFNANVLIGGAGVDNLSGGAGDDILNAGGSSGSAVQSLSGGLGADTFIFDLNDGFFKTYVGDFRIEQSDKLEFIGVVDANNDGSKLDDLDAIFGVGVTNTLFLGFTTVFTAVDGSQLLISGGTPPVHLSDLSANIIFG